MDNKREIKVIKAKDAPQREAEQSRLYSAYRNMLSALIELTPEETAEIRADFQAGLIDLQTALEMRGFKNVQEIIDRMPKPQAPPPQLTGDNGQ